MLSKHINREQYADTDLFDLIIDEVVQGNYTNVPVLVNICFSESFQEAMYTEIIFEQKIVKIKELARHCAPEIKKETNSDALLLVGCLYHLGYGVKQDLVFAIVFYEYAMGLGNVTALTLCAGMYHSGAGGFIDLAKSIELYERAIELGDPQAMNILASMYYRGEGVFHNVDKAAALLDKAIALGYTKALYNRAVIYAETKEFDNAIWLWERAAREGNDDAAEMIKKYSIDQGSTENLITLMWDELIQGLPITEHTLEALCTYGKDTVLEKIHNSELATSLSFLKSLKTNLHHPLAQIINTRESDIYSFMNQILETGALYFFNRKPEKQSTSAEFKALMKQVPSIAETRAMFFKMKHEKQNCPFATLPIELRESILTLTQPGFERDNVDRCYDEDKFNCYA